MAELPSGTLTFLFTDLEVSTALWESQPDQMRQVVARHDELLGAAVSAGGGHVVKTTGDGLVAVFAVASDGVAAALACQQVLAAEEWPVPVKARMGLYTGEAQPVDGDYHAPVLNRAARVMSAGHGGQVLLAASTAGLVRGGLSDGAVPEAADPGCVAGKPGNAVELVCGSCRRPGRSRRGGGSIAAGDVDGGWGCGKDPLGVAGRSAATPKIP